jgi:hypothetical protein
MQKSEPQSLHRHASRLSKHTRHHVPKRKLTRAEADSIVAEIMLRAERFRRFQEFVEKLNCDLEEAEHQKRWSEEATKIGIPECAGRWAFHVPILELIDFRNIVNKIPRGGISSDELTWLELTLDGVGVGVMLWLLFGVLPTDEESEDNSALLALHDRWHHECTPSHCDLVYGLFYENGKITNNHIFPPRKP